MEEIDIEVIKESMPMWLFEQNIEEDIIQEIFDSFFMTPIHKKEKTLINNYNKSREMIWHRNGRLATEKEVELGVSSLVGTELWGELRQQMEVYLAAMTGRKFGVYSSNNVSQIATDMIKLSNNKDEFLKKYEQLKKYKPKYSKFEPDEIVKDTSMVEVLEHIRIYYKKSVHGSDENCKRAMYLSLRRFDGRLKESELATEDKINCRKVYEQMLTEFRTESVVDGINEELKNKCESLIEHKGIELNANEFVYKIIDTLQKFGYKKCSDKQLAIIDEALKKIDVQDMQKGTISVEDMLIANSIFNAEQDLAGMMVPDFLNLFE